MFEQNLWVLKRPPFKAQFEAIRKGWDKTGFNFYMEQGLGKSATLLNNFELLRRAGKVKKLIIVCPNSFKGGWVDEVKKAGLTTPVAVWRADRRQAFLDIIRSEAEFIAIVNFESLYMVVEDWGQLISGPYAMLGVDESIKIKNPKARTTKAALALAAASGFVRNLSGKPVTQGSHDLWAQLKAIRFINKMNFYAFRNRFCLMGGYLGKQVVGAQNTDELNGILERTSFLARKKDWTDLPAKLEPISLETEMEGRQLSMYKQMERDFVAELAEAAMPGSRVTVDMVITRNIKMRQIMSGWIYKEDGEVEIVVPLDKNPRFRIMKDLIDDTIVGKAVIVAFFKPTIDALLKEFEEAGYNPAYIRGQMKPEDIEEQKRRFNEDDDCKVMVVQQVAAKYGHTLLGTENEPCSTMFFFEQSYSLDDRSQIEDRIHRYGQRWPCSYFDFYAGSLDYQVVRALQRKESVAAAILGYANSEKAA